jgi:hypothetical protein
VVDSGGLIMQPPGYEGSWEYCFAGEGCVELIFRPFTAAVRASRRDGSRLPKGTRRYARRQVVARINPDSVEFVEGHQRISRDWGARFVIDWLQGQAEQSLASGSRSA